MMIEQFPRSIMRKNLKGNCFSLVQSDRDAISDFFYALLSGRLKPKIAQNETS